MEESELVTAALEDPERMIAYVATALREETSMAERAQLLRVRALAERGAGALDRALATAREAIDVASGGAAEREEGLAWATLGTTLMFAGDFEAAEQALEQGRPLVSGRDRLELDGQYAGLLARSGQVQRGLETLAQHAVEAEQLEELTLAANARANLGMLLIQDRRADAAAVELRRSRQHFEHLDLPVAAAQMTHNLGCVAGLQGDFQQALDLFNAADSALSGIGIEGDTIRLLDRAEAELHAGLFRDAALDAAEAASLHEERGSHAGQAEALLVLAHALLARGQTVRAHGVAEKARALFAGQDRPGWAAEAELMCARCAPGETIDDLLALVDRFDAADQPRLATSARLLACHAGRYDLLETVGERGDLSAPDRLLFDLARVQQMVKLGDPTSALALVRDALTEAAAERSAVDSVELRSAFSATVRELREVGATLVQDDPAGLFEFAEWGSLIAVEPVVVRRPDDPDLAHAVAELRMATESLRAAEREFEDTTDIVNDLRRVERRVSDLQRRARSHGAAPLAEPVDLERVAAAVGSISLTRFVCFGDRVLRLDLVDGTATVRPLGSASSLQSLIGDFHAAVQRDLLPALSDRAAAMAHDRARERGQELDDRLFAGFGGGPVVIIPGSDFAALPWRRLPSRVDEPTFLVPAAGLLTAVRQRPRSTLRAVSIAGPSLAHSDHEAAEVASVYESSTLLSAGSPLDEVLAELRQADVVHIAAHGYLRPDQPLLSSVELHGGPLTVADLQRVRPAPRVVVLASCSAARELPLDGDELYGMASALLIAGSEYVVASPVAIPDTPATGRAVVALHRSIAKGVDPDGALRACRAELDEPARLIADSLVVFGAP